MALWPRGQAQVCKTCYSSSNLLGTSKRRVRASELFFLRLFGDITRGFICCKYFKNVRFFVFFVYVCNLSTIVRNFF